MSASPMSGLEKMKKPLVAGGIVLTAAALTLPATATAALVGAGGAVSLAADGVVNKSNSLVAKAWRGAKGFLRGMRTDNGERALALADTSRDVRLLDLDYDQLDPHIWENACTILGLSLEEGTSEEDISRAYSHSITQLTIRREAVDGPVRAEIGALIQEVTVAHQTLVDRLVHTIEQQEDRIPEANESPSRSNAADQSSHTAQSIAGALLI